MRGVTRIDEFNEYFGAAAVRGEGFDTIAGLVMKQLGRLPRRGESASSRASSSACCAPTAAASMRCKRGRAARRAAAGRAARGRRGPRLKP